MKSPFRCLLISDFNIDNFAAYLSNNDEWPSIQPVRVPYGQVISALVSRADISKSTAVDMTVIWTRPDNIIESFSRLAAYERVSDDQILQEVDLFCDQIKNAKTSLGSVFIPSWVIPSYFRGFEMLDMKPGLGIKASLMKMNQRLATNLSTELGFFILDTDQWIRNVGSRSFSPKAWYMGKIAFGNDIFKEAVKDIKSAARGICGKAKKLIIVDLDETLWGGIVGDLGWKDINLGGHDPIGEAFVDFQKALKSLLNRGIILAIVSKNDESVAMDAIRHHPEMVLKTDDFAGWRINWSDKAANIIELLSELNLGVDSVVFIDDNPVERARVKDALPDVLVPDWPEDKMLYKKALLELTCFNNPSISVEDTMRTQMYVSERKRETLKKQVSSLEDWLQSIDMKVHIEELDEKNLLRTAQLLNKTNQMNLSTRRMSDSDLITWVNGAGRKLWTFRVSDKYGDSGLTGIISIEKQGSAAKIVDFVLSCRVMGRKVEELMLSTVIQYAKRVGIKEVCAEYLPTPKNNPCLEFFQRSGFLIRGENSFVWNPENDYNPPPHIKVLYS
jgi:FkbH-like protein